MDPNATCAYHPDRLAGSACQRCGKPICPACMNAASVGFHCPECTRSGRTKVINPVAQSRDHSLGSTPVTTAYVAMIVIAYIAQVVYLHDAQGVVAWNRYAIYGPSVASGEWWRIFTYSLIHQGPPHMLFNAYLAFVLGRRLERSAGSTNLVAVLLVGCVGGAVGSLAFGEYGGGASGVVFALMAYLIVEVLLQGGTIASSGLGLLLVLNLVVTFMDRNIGIGGHLGGLAAGAIAALIIRAAPKADLPGWVRTAGLYSLAAFLTGAAMMIAQTTA